MLGYTKGRSTRSQTTSISKTGRNHPSVGPNKYDPGRATRANPNPFCTHFGKMRQSIYPTAFFCSNCEWWEKEVDVCNKRVSRQSKTYSCMAKHYSWLVPRPLWTVSNNRMLSKEEVAVMEEEMWKENEDNDKVEHITNKDEDTVCTVDEEDVEDNGSSCAEDVCILGFQEATAAADPNIGDNSNIPYTPPLHVGGVIEDDNDYILDTEIPPPSKRLKVMSDLQEELDVLKLKLKNSLQNPRTTARLQHIGNHATIKH